MPFKFDKYRTWCYGQDPLLLQKEFDRYTRETMAGSAGTNEAIGLAPVTFGLSTTSSTIPSGQTPTTTESARVVGPSV